MEQPERDIEITALLTFNTNDPMNALNDLATHATNASSSKALNPDSTPLIPTPRVDKSKAITQPVETSSSKAHTLYLIRLEEPFETPTKLRELAGLSSIPVLQGSLDDPIVFCTVNEVEKQLIEESVSGKELGVDLFFMEYVAPSELISTP